MQAINVGVSGIRLRRRIPETPTFIACIFPICFSLISFYMFCVDVDVDVYLIENNDL